MKYLQRNGLYRNTYFWRTHDQKEIDYIEEFNEKLIGYEFKWGKSNYKKPMEFLKTYQNSEIHLIHQKNYHDFLM